MTEKTLHVIVGLGVTGMSCARYLARCGIPFAVTDSREQPPQGEVFSKIFPSVRTSFGCLDESLLDEADVIVLSPGVSLEEKAIARQKKKSKSVINDVELFVREVTVPIIAITGTNAKSTVTTLVGDMMMHAGRHVGVGGNIGVPVLDMLERLEIDVFVLELSSFQLETIKSLKPAVACILNITPDHLDRHHTFENYVAAKHQVYHHADTSVWNLDDPLTRPVSAKKQCQFGLNHSGSAIFSVMKEKAGEFLAYDGQTLMDVLELKVPGKHFQANVLAALAIGHAYGLSMEPMLEAIRAFQGLPHRCQLVRQINGVSWYNDSKGTNVGATLAAIEGLGQAIPAKIVLIAGGVGKGADFSSLLPVIKKHVRHVVLLGEAAQMLSGLIDGAVTTSFAGSMAQAVQQASEAARLKDVVLLSPACASFDMFENFEQRGQIFMDVVAGLQGEA